MGLRAASQKKMAEQDRRESMPAETGVWHADDGLFHRF
ncbi:hypothetical protein KKH3_35140 [Pectobacterium actinidiae]|nr:hypothetical protein KKH3_35140 [Pectobacterium actinidiae]